jgi:hypothetical protein
LLNNKNKLKFNTMFFSSHLYLHHNVIAGLHSSSQKLQASKHCWVSHIEYSGAQLNSRSPSKIEVAAAILQKVKG